MANRDKKHRYAKWMIVAALVLAGLASWYFLPVQHWLTILNNFFDRLGWWGILLYVAVAAVGAVFFLPRSIVGVGAGLIFGFWAGSAIAWLGSMLGALNAYLVGRYLLRGYVEARTRNHPKLRRLDKSISRRGWKVVVLSRLAPVVPYGVLNYFGGTSEVGLLAYLGATGIGMIPGLMLDVYLGSLGNTGLQLLSGGPGRHPVEYLGLGVGLVATITIAWYAKRLARRSMESDTPEEAA